MRKQVSVGQIFNELTVIGKNSYNVGDFKYDCLCSCGRRSTVCVYDLLNGNTKSCGCKRGENHGKRNSELYARWLNMKSRVGCYKTISRNDNKYYKDRGISICDEWKQSFKVFYDWAMKNGYKKGLEIDRINNDGDYSPENCQFITHKINSQKRDYCKINHDIASNIRKEYVYGSIDWGSVSLARKYGVSKPTILDVVHGRRWT
jgi:hypothetical protein